MLAILRLNVNFCQPKPRSEPKTKSFWYRYFWQMFTRLKKNKAIYKKIILPTDLKKMKFTLNFFSFTPIINMKTVHKLTEHVLHYF